MRELYDKGGIQVGLVITPKDYPISATIEQPVECGPLGSIPKLT